MYLGSYVGPTGGGLFRMSEVPLYELAQNLPEEPPHEYIPPGCTKCSCAKTRGERLISVRVYLGTATLSNRLHLQLRDSTSLSYTYAAYRRPLRLIPHPSVRQSTG